MTTVFDKEEKYRQKTTTNIDRDLIATISEIDKQNVDLQTIMNDMKQKYEEKIKLLEEELKLIKENSSTRVQNLLNKLEELEKLTPEDKLKKKVGVSLKPSVKKSSTLSEKSFKKVLPKQK